MAEKLRPELPIAVFDSGVGGLTVLHELLVSLPAENFLYLGDSAHFPYGTRSPDDLSDLVERNTKFLLDRGAKLLVVACNAASASALDIAGEIAAQHGIEAIGVVEPAAEIAAAISASGKVGVLATPTTVATGAYRRALSHQGRSLQVTEVAAADLAPIIQNGFPFDAKVVETVRTYCAPLKEAEVDTVVLGCTHFPLIAPMLQRILGRNARLVSAGHAVAATAQRNLEGRGLLIENDAEGDYRFICTGDVEAFRELGTRFLQMPLGAVEPIEIE